LFFGDVEFLGPVAHFPFFIKVNARTVLRSTVREIVRHVVVVSPFVVVKWSNPAPMRELFAVVADHF